MQSLLSQPFRLGAVSADPAELQISYASALVAVDILRDIAPNAPEVDGLLKQVDAYGASVDAGTATTAQGAAIEVGARTALEDYLRRRQLISGFVGAAIVGTVALGGWYAARKRRKR